MILNCSACAKPIDTQPPECPACGVRQPEPEAASQRRLALLAGALIISAGIGGWCGLELRVGHSLSRATPTPSRPPRDAEQEALRARVRELVARLKSDSKAPYAELEDALLQPQLHIPGKVTVIAYLFSLKTPGGGSGRLSVGWGHGAMLDIDLRGLSEPERVAAVGLTDKPHLVAASGALLQRMGGDPVLIVDRLESLGAPRGIETVPQLVSAP